MTTRLSTPAESRGCGRQAVDRPYAPGRCRDWIKVKRQRTVDCVVVGVAGEPTTPKLVLALRPAPCPWQLASFRRSRPLAGERAPPLAVLIGDAGAEQPAIRSRWQHDAISPWRRVSPRLVRELRVSNLDAGRWARFPAVFVRWRLDRSPRGMRARPTRCLSSRARRQAGLPWATRPVLSRQGPSRARLSWRTPARSSASGYAA
jgi:hypothetical protein